MATRSEKHTARRRQDHDSYRLGEPNYGGSPRFVSGAFTETEWNFLQSFVLSRLAGSTNPIAKELIRIFECPEDSGFRRHELEE
jgi:hypothetical protein